MLGLAAAVTVPVLISGWMELGRAERAQASSDPVGAMQHYKNAVRSLPWRSDLWERAGREALAAGQLDDAIHLLERAPRLSADGWLALAEANRRMGNIDAAESGYRAALKQAASAEAYAGIAYVARLHNDPETERAALQNSLLLAPGDAASEFRLGLLLALAEPAQALAHLQTAAHLDGEYQGVYQTLSAALRQADLQPTHSQALLYRGRGLALVGDWELARRAFEQAVLEDPNLAEGWAWLGEAKQHLGMDAGSELDRAVSLDGSSTVVRGLRGLYWKRQGREREALAEYLAAATAEPENPAWAASMGESYARLGDMPSALASFQRAADLAKRDPVYWRLLATFCVEYNIQLADVGLPAARKAAQLAPEDPLALDVLGWAQLANGERDAARQTLLSALEHGPQSASAHLHLALVYLQDGDRQGAYDHLQRALELDPQGSVGSQAASMLKQYFP